MRVFQEFALVAPQKLTRTACASGAPPP